MIAIAIEKLTGKVTIFSQIEEYTEVFKPNNRRWYHCLQNTGGQTVLIDSKNYRISLKDKEIRK